MRQKRGGQIYQTMQHIREHIAAFVEAFIRNSSARPRRGPEERAGTPRPYELVDDADLYARYDGEAEDGV